MPKHRGAYLKSTWREKKAERRRAYKAYLRSRAWQEKRSLVIARDGKCVKCGRIESLQVHHINYSTFGNEDLEDLETLCQDCHRTEHGGTPRPKKKKKPVKLRKKFTAYQKDEMRRAALRQRDAIDRLDKQIRSAIMSRSRKP